MNVKPARALTGLTSDFEGVYEGDLHTIYAGRDLPGAMMLECKVYSPPSAEGRRVWLLLDGKDVVDLLKELRDCAIRARQKTMADSDS